MLRGKVKSLKKDLEKLKIDKEKRLYIAYVNREEDQVLVELDRIKIFEGSYSGFSESKSVLFNPNDVIIEMSWYLRGPNI